MDRRLLVAAALLLFVELAFLAGGLGFVHFSERKKRDGAIGLITAVTSTVKSRGSGSLWWDEAREQDPVHTRVNVNRSEWPISLHCEQDVK